MIILLAENIFQDDTTRWVAMIFGAIAMMYFVFRPMLKKKKDPLERSPVKSSLAQQRAVEQQMNELLVEMSNMARQITAQLDTRSAKLEVLIREADERLAALRRATGGGSVSVQHEQPAPHVEQEQPHSDPQQISNEVDARHAQVYALADEGLPPREIAQRVGRPTGEIELILALRPRASAGEGLSDS